MNVIEINQLVKTFDKQTVLKGIDISVEKGEVFGFLGPNGAGKTTTTRIILGLFQPTSGQALVFNRKLGENPELRKRVGVLLEDDGLYPRLGAYDNLAYFARLYELNNARQRINETLEIVGLKGKEKELPGHFSKGMKRRLALARAMLHEPELLLLDEPSSGLDPEAQILVRDLITELSTQKGVTILLNSHDLNEVQRVCSRVAIIQRGEIKATDTIENLTGTQAPLVSVTFGDAAEAQKGEAILNTHHNIVNTHHNIVRFSRRENHLEIELQEGADASVLLGEFLGSGLRIEEVKKLGKSLEDIYLKAVREDENK